MRHTRSLLPAFALLLASSSADSAGQDAHRVTVKLDNALTAESPKVRDWVLSPEIRFLLVDGEVRSPVIHLKRGWTVPSWKGVVDEFDLTHTRGRVTGSLRARIFSGATVKGTYDINVDAAIGDGIVSGTHRTVKSGGTERRDELRGTVEAVSLAGDPVQDGVWTVHLVEALPKGEVLTVYLDRHDGKFSGFAFSPNTSRRPMEVDTSGLRFGNTRLTGRITVDRLDKENDGTRSTFGKYDVDAHVDGSKIRGRFSGTTVDDERVADELVGEVRRRETVPRDARIWIKCEDGYTGGAMWQNRVFFKFRLEDGTFVEGTADNNKGVFEASLNDAELTLTRNTVTGTLKSTVVSSTAVRNGEYTFAVEGLRSGDVLCGRFRTRLPGRDVQAGYFVGGIQR